MKKTCPILLLLLCACSRPSQQQYPPSTEDRRTAAVPEDQRQVVKKQAELMAKALLNDDFETLVRYTYPKLVEEIGGKEAMVEVVKTTMGEMKRKGFGILSVAVEMPDEIVAGGSNLYAIVPQRVVAGRPKGGKITADSYLIAVSSDKGKNWTFIDGSKVSPVDVRKTLPDFPASLKLPVFGKPVIE